MKLAEIIRDFFAVLFGFSEKEEETPKQPAPKQPTPEELPQFKMKQCLKHMEKNVQSKEAERAKAFETVRQHLRAGDDLIARIYAKNVVSLNAEVIRAHTQLSSVQLLADKMNEGAFNAEATQILGEMADAIQATSSVADIDTLLKNFAKVDEIGLYLCDVIEDPDPIFDVTTGPGIDVKTVMEQAARTDVVTEPGMNSSGNASLNAGEASAAEQAEDGLKALSDLINGKK